MCGKKEWEIPFSFLPNLSMLTSLQMELLCLTDSTAFPDPLQPALFPAVYTHCVTDIFWSTLGLTPFLSFGCTSWTWVAFRKSERILDLAPGAQGSWYLGWLGHQGVLAKPCKRFWLWGADLLPCASRWPWEGSRPRRKNWGSATPSRCPALLSCLSRERAMAATRAWWPRAAAPRSPRRPAPPPPQRQVRCLGFTQVVASQDRRRALATEKRSQTVQNHASHSGLKRVFFFFSSFF